MGKGSPLVSIHGPKCLPPTSKKALKPLAYLLLFQASVSGRTQHGTQNALDPRSPRPPPERIRGLERPVGESFGWCRRYGP
jgi:hypothetical protein